MTPQQLLSHLQNIYTVKLFCDLGSITTSPSALYRVLDDVYQPAYQAVDRLVFYTNQPVPKKLIDHLYQTTNSIDITNCFVLICGPNDIGPLIDSARAESSDLTTFQFYHALLCETQPIQDQFGLPDTICAIPWTNLEIRSDGKITPCCMSTGIELGRVQTHTLEQAFSSEPVRRLRASLLAGEKPGECYNCWKVEAKNLSSIRTLNIKRLEKKFLKRYIDRPEISTLDIKFNNTCNFKCRICGPHSSSLFALEAHKHRGWPLQPHEPWEESKSFIDQVNNLLPGVHNIDMYGGEPFLVKKFSKVLAHAIKTGIAKNIRLHYNSNGSIWPGEFLPYWPDFQLVDIHFSIDAVGQQFELQRGGSWQEVERNILKLKNLNLPNLVINVMPTISVMSILYIDKVYDWANQHGFPIFVSHARGSGLELNDLTREAKLLIKEKYKDHPWEEMQKILQVIEKLPDGDGMAFQNQMKWFDRIRGESFADNHSEIAKAMKYI